MDDSFDSVRAFFRRTEEAWTDYGRLCTLAYTQMRSVLTVLIHRIESTVGLTLNRQRDAPQDGSFRPPRRWALDNRTAVLWSDQLHVPLHENTLSHLDRSERRHTPDLSSVEVEIDGRKFDPVRRPSFRAFYHPQPGFQYPICLYDVYVTKGGSGDVLRTDLSGRTRPVPAFYVPDVLSTSRARLTARDIERIMREGLRTALVHDPDRFGGLTYSDLAPLTSARAFQCTVTNQVMSHTRVR